MFLENLSKDHIRIFWKGMKKYIQTFIRECQVFQRNKVDIVKLLVLLQPLHIANQIWEEISMDFSTYLPKSQGTDAILILPIE